MSGAPFAIPELAGSGCPAPVTTPLAAQNSAVSCSRAAALPATTTGQLAAVPQTRVGDALVVAAGNDAAFDSLFIGSRSQVQVAQQVRPTFLIVHLGDDDVLPAAMTGVLGPLTTGGDPQLTEQSTFSTQYNQLIGDVASTSIAGGVLIGVTNPLLYAPLLQPGAFYFLSRDPATSRFEGKPVNNNCSPVNALGSPNPLADNLVSMRILTDAAVPEINCDPAMTGPGSPYLLDAQERAAMTARVDQFNSVISGIATARNWVYLDMNAFLAPLRAETASGRHDRLRKCQLLPGAASAAQFQNAVLSVVPAVCTSAAFIAAAVSGAACRAPRPDGSASVGRPPARLTIDSITSSSGPISSAPLRWKLSVESTHRVTTGMASSSHHSTNSLSLSAPAW